VDYAALGFTGERDPRREDISKTRRAAILDEMMMACRLYVGTEFLAALKARCQDILGTGDGWSLQVSPLDANIIQFRYPTATSKALSYVAPQVVLELGTHAEFVPHDRFMIRSFVAEAFPNLIEDGDVPVVALLAERTFWEKVTILHAEYYRPSEKPLPERYSRHYYDVAMLAERKIRPEGLADMTLLSQVVTHKETFYPAAWARYDLARRGSLRLLPAEERVGALERDYRNMGVMIFGVAPAFDRVMETLKTLEKEINW
jgi:hypothetical protein